MSLGKTLGRIDDAYVSVEFLQVINDHLFIIREGSTKQSMQSNISLKFENDFYGLLRQQGILPQYWNIVLRVNGHSHPCKCGIVTKLLIPDTKYIDDLLSTQKLSKRNLF